MKCEKLNQRKILFLFRFFLLKRNKNKIFRNAALNACFKKNRFFFRKNHETFLIGIGIVVNGDSHTKYKNVIAASVKVKYRYKMFVKFCLSVYFLQC